MIINWDGTLPFIAVMSSGVDPADYEDPMQYEAVLASAMSFDLGFSLILLFGLVSVLVGWICRTLSRS